jgi:Fe-S-cluster containining protein
MQRAVLGEAESAVPCDGCTACCTSSQFVHIGPDEADTLAHIPARLLFPAPGAPDGTRLLGYDQNGHCPMLIDGKCSIYEHRPRTCRTYDCRVFAATGIAIEDDKPAIAHRVARWRFDFTADLDHEQYVAVRTAARSVRERTDVSREAPGSATQHAVLAIETQVGEGNAS